MGQAHARRANGFAVGDGKWSDWIEVDQKTAAIVFDVPRIYVKDGRFYIHRTHMPIARERGVDISWPSATPWTASWKVLRPYQVAGAAFIRERQGCLVADEPRVGKTFTSIGAHELSDGPLYVFSPLNIRSVWRKALSDRWPNEPIAILKGRKYTPESVTWWLGGKSVSLSRHLREAKLVYCHYDLFPSWNSISWNRPARVVFDEIHKFSNFQTPNSKLALQLARSSDSVVGLTGTPLWNSPDGTYVMLAMLCHPGFGSYWDYATRYASGCKGPYGFVTGSPSHVEELRGRLREIMIRRTRKEVFAEMAEPIREVVTVELTTEDERRIDFEAATLQSELRVANTVIGQMARLRRLLGELKADKALDYILPHVDKPLVVWTWHVHVGQKLERALKKQGIPTYRINGRMPGERREGVLDAWREEPRGVLIATIACGQLGIDLSHADRCVFVELDFTPSTIGQAELRVFSPVYPMHSTYLAVSHPIEQQIVTALKTKLDYADEMGLPAADMDIRALGEVFGIEDEGDMNRLMSTLLEDE